MNVMIRKNAVLSKDRQYRYLLTRLWDINKGIVLFVCLNPSTADEMTDDPTVKRCMRYAYDWGYGGIKIVNLFALRSSKPENLYKHDLPVGISNNAYIIRESRKAALTIAAWGCHGSFMDREELVLPLLKNPHCLGVTKDGHPKHPLFLKKTLKPVRF